MPKATIKIDLDVWNTAKRFLRYSFSDISPDGNIMYANYDALTPDEKSLAGRTEFENLIQQIKF